MLLPLFSSFMVKLGESRRTDPTPRLPAGGRGDGRLPTHSIDERSMSSSLPQRLMEAAGQREVTPVCSCLLLFELVWCPGGVVCVFTFLRSRPPRSRNWWSPAGCCAEWRNLHLHLAAAPPPGRAGGESGHSGGSLLIRGVQDDSGPWDSGDALCLLTCLFRSSLW